MGRTSFSRFAFFPSALLALPALLVFAGAVGCKKAETDPGKVGQAAPFPFDQSFVETQPTGTVAWNIPPSGQVQAALRTKEGLPLPGPVTGTMQWTAPGQDPQTTPIAYTDGTLTATGPQLTADVTEAKYAIDANGTPWTGVLHLPPGGTPQIIADANTAAPIQVPAGKVGPHGGRIQVVGPDRLELVANAPTGEVRVYELDANYAPIPLADHRITLGVVADQSEVIALDPDPTGFYCTGVWGIGVDPWRLDASVRIGPRAYFGVWGFAPGLPLLVGPAAPRFGVRLTPGWGPPLIRGRMLVASPRIDVGFPRGAFHGGVEVGGAVRGEGLRHEERREEVRREEGRHDEGHHEEVRREEVRHEEVRHDERGGGRREEVREAPRGEPRGGGGREPGHRR